MNILVSLLTCRDTYIHGSNYVFVPIANNMTLMQLAAELAL